ncbi:MAG: glycosyl transferase family 1 [Cellulomonas sp. 73-145]|uniref:glycosyltransferase n=1 Tax=Cellulomonas sp. 73-145 TaxID=1895739 RepID=UPI000929C620|nr:glycosyltransferase [Cellulomonas sp. 73-145]MBN9326708.1 glycosyltransferase [Cellulomonas sp.]OJV59058.1 MAG: glycosyl transferase family 1 [Cellulomonas sp. 73-145]
MSTVPDGTTPGRAPTRRLVLVVRADPVICGHSGEARNLAEAALQRGFDDVRIVTWPLDVLQRAGLPLKPLDGVLPYSDGITVERPGPVGDYKVPDGRWLAGLTGRLVELFTDGVPTVAMSLYLSPHATAVADAVRIARSTGLPVDVVTVAEAVGSDVTNVVRACVEEDRFGAAAQVLASYLDHDVCLAVSRYTRDMIVGEARAIDAKHGTRFAAQCEERVHVSYPAIDVAAYLARDDGLTDAVLAARGLTRGGYVLYLSRLAHAKGVDDLIEAYAASRSAGSVELVVAGNGPQAEALHSLAATTAVAERIRFLHDVDDDEKAHLMAGARAFALPSKSMPEFTETFGIALVESMLSCGGPVITTDVGGIGEAVGDTALIVPQADPPALAAALDRAVLGMSDVERESMAEQALAHARQFDRMPVLDAILGRVAEVRAARVSLV